MLGTGRRRTGMVRSHLNHPASLFAAWRAGMEFGSADTGLERCHVLCHTWRRSWFPNFTPKDLGRSDFGSPSPFLRPQGTRLSTNFPLSGDALNTHANILVRVPVLFVPVIH